MNHDELIDKAMSVACSCQTIDQLRTASRYCELVYRQLRKDRSFVLRDLALIERSIGFAQAKIKYAQVTE